MNLTYHDWHSICKLVCRHNCITASEIPSQNKDVSWIVIKHDVETNPSRALEIAKIESLYSIRATYYIQANLLRDNSAVIYEIKNLGHEIGYHYDVLDANSGDMSRASLEFDSNLREFALYGFSVSSVCPHGNPLLRRIGWESNRDFFSSVDVQRRFSDIFDIVVQLKGYVSERYCYVSDAGYGFKVISDIATVNGNSGVSISKIEEMRDLIAKSRQLVISTHPHRWVSNRVVASIRKLAFFFIRRNVKFISKLPGIRVIIDKLYFLAKHI